MRSSVSSPASSTTSSPSPSRRSVVRVRRTGCVLAHSAALSKLTNRRMSALYREWLLGCEQVVEPMLGRGDRWREAVAECLEATSADRRQHRFDSFLASREIVDASFDQLEIGEVRGSAHDSSEILERLAFRLAKSSQALDEPRAVGRSLPQTVYRIAPDLQPQDQDASLRRRFYAASETARAR